MTEHTVTETCSCGATFTITTDYGSRALQGAHEWRKEHQHPTGQPRTIRPRPALANPQRGKR